MPGDPECPRCAGSGRFVVERPWDDPRFGKAEPCDCVLRESGEVRRSRLERISNLGTLTRFTFETLAPAGDDADRDWSGRARAAAEAFADDPRGWLVFTGPSGSGKTHFAAAIANRRIALGSPALFMVVPDMLDHLRSSYDAADEDVGFDQLFEHVRNAPLLLLDDIDAAAPTPWAKEKLLQVVNHRYNLQLPTVFTCSTRPKLLDDRMATRLSDPQVSTILPLEGPRASAGYDQVGGMTRERLSSMMFRDLVESSRWSETERSNFTSVLLAARTFAEDPQGWLVIRGEHGCGKTHLAAAIANKALAGGLSVFFAVVPDLLDHLRATFAPSSETTYDELFERVRNAELLVLDDLGAHQSSPWAEEKLFQIVNYRTLLPLPTVVSTNLQPGEFQKLHPRLYARIFDPHAGSLIEVLAPHYALGRAPGRSEPPRRRGPAR